MRPIDTDALIEVVEKSMAENPHKEKTQRAMHIHEHKYFLTLLAGIPTIQPVATDTNVGDTISRQAAIDAVNAMRFGMEKMAFEIITTKLLELPPAQPKQHEGEWSDGYRWQRCSLCKQTGKKSWNYCPNCGAKMTISTK